MGWLMRWLLLSLTYLHDFIYNLRFNLARIAVLVSVTSDVESGNCEFKFSGLSKSSANCRKCTVSLLDSSRAWLIILRRAGNRRLHLVAVAVAAQHSVPWALSKVNRKPKTENLPAGNNLSAVWGFRGQQTSAVSAWLPPTVPPPSLLLLAPFFRRLSAFH